MEVLHSQIEADGRVILPPEVLDELELKAGNDLEFQVTDGSVRILPSTHERIKRIQERLKNTVPYGVSVVDEFLAERRAEAGNE